MRKHSLYHILIASFLIIALIDGMAIYFSLKLHQKDLVEAAIQEKIHLAETINEIMNSPAWIYRLAMVSDLEKVFIEEMAAFADVKYIRLVSAGGTIQESSIKEEKGEIVKDPDIQKVVTTRSEVVKDQVFGQEKIKLIIYPGYQDKTIWVGFSLAGIEEAIKAIWIRDYCIIAGVLILLLLFLFWILKSIINPLKMMSEVCEEIGKGNLDVKMEVKSKTEIGELAATFNRMVEELKKSKEVLEEEKNSLEIRVKARTKELKELTEQLEKKVAERTKELEERLKELERFQQVAVGRELKMIELKEEIKKLKEELGKRKK